jgi:hypothetical protein
MKLIVTIAVTTGLLLAATAAPAHAGAEGWTLGLEKGSDGKVRVATVGVQPGETTIEQDTVLTIECVKMSCLDLKPMLTVGDKDEKAADVKTLAATRDKRQILIKATATKLVVTSGKDELFSTNLVAAEQTEDDRGETQTGTNNGDTSGTTTPPKRPRTVQDLVESQCPRKKIRVPGYDRDGDVGHVWISPNGAVLSPLPKRFDQNDTLVVMIYADERLLRILQVSRKSDFAIVAGTILGADVKLPDSITRHGEGGKADTPTCGVGYFSVTNFAPGRGEIEVSARLAEQDVSLGSFEIAVDPVYSGMFSLGAAWTPLVDPDFGVASRDGEQVVIATETGSRRLSYVFLYTPFLWDGLERDVRKGPRKFWHRINPSVGFVVDDPLDNVLFGATVDVRAAILFTAGVYVSHVRKLDGVDVGDTFSGESSDLPVTKHWDKDWFVSVSIDLRAAVSLVRAVLGTATEGGTP